MMPTSRFASARPSPRHLNRLRRSYFVTARLSTVPAGGDTRARDPLDASLDPEISGGLDFNIPARGNPLCQWAIRPDYASPKLGR